jgi:hypothetical protein
MYKLSGMICFYFFLLNLAVQIMIIFCLKAMILIFFSFQNKNEVNEQGKRVLIDEIYYSLFNSND